jgi:hypothetical protein
MNERRQMMKLVVEVTEQVDPDLVGEEARLSGSTATRRRHRSCTPGSRLQR